jgi:hypothetical protein
MTYEEIKNLYDEFNVLEINENETSILITVVAKSDTAVCPFCNTTSNKVRQRYTKTIQDLPINKKDVRLIIKSRVFYCFNTDCNHFSFNEQYEIVKPLKKKTIRLINHIYEVTNANSYRKAGIMLNEEGIKLSDSTANKITKKINRGQN